MKQRLYFVEGAVGFQNFKNIVPKNTLLHYFILAFELRNGQWVEIKNRYGLTGKTIKTLDEVFKYSKTIRGNLHLFI